MFSVNVTSANDSVTGDSVTGDSVTGDSVTKDIKEIMSRLGGEFYLRWFMTFETTTDISATCITFLNKAGVYMMHMHISNPYMSQTGAELRHITIDH